MLAEFKKSEEPKLLYRFYYHDNSTVLRTFKDKKDMQWFANNEGDALLHVELIAGSSG